MKKLIVFVSGAVSACVFNAAYAQSSVTLYGVIDNGVEYQNPGSSPATIRAISGGLFASRYGLKGSEDIGRGRFMSTFSWSKAFRGQPVRRRMPRMPLIVRLGWAFPGALVRRALGCKIRPNTYS